MSTPCELLLVWCPCGAVYSDSWRASMNLSLGDDFDDDEEMSSTTCPDCGLNTPLGTLLSRIDNDRQNVVLTSSNVRHSQKHSVGLLRVRPTQLRGHRFALPPTHRTTPAVSKGPKESSGRYPLLRGAAGNERRAPPARAPVPARRLDRQKA